MTFFKFFTHQSPLWQIAIVSFVVMALADVIPILRTRKILKWIAATVVIVAVLLCFAKPSGTGGGEGGGNGKSENVNQPVEKPNPIPHPVISPQQPFSLTITVKGSYHVTIEGLDSIEIHEEDKDEFWNKFEEALKGYKTKGICKEAFLISPQGKGFEKILVETTHNILGNDIEFKEITKGNP